MLHKQIERYLQQGKQLNLSQKTIANRRNVLYPLLDFLKGKDITLARVQEYISHFCNKELAPGSVDCYIKTIRAFVTFLELDWAKKLLRPKLHRTAFDIIPAELAEKVIFTATAIGPNSRINKSRESQRLCLRFILRTGLRVAEALSLTNESLNFEDETFRVLSKGGNVDLLPLPKDMIPELRKATGNSRLFSANAKTLNTSLQRGAAILGLTIHLTVHSFRHVFATSLLKNGISPAIVQRLMRHKSFEITNNTYAHYIISDLANALNSQVIVKKGLSASEIFDSVEKAARAIIGKDERFRLQIQADKKSLTLRIDAF